MLVFLLAFHAGYWRADKAIEKFEMEKRNNFFFSGQAEVLGAPQQKNGYQQIVFALDGGPGGNVLAQANSLTSFAHGDKVQLGCTLRLPENFSTEKADAESSQFDYRMYLAAKDIVYLCQKPKITLLNKGAGFFVKLLEIREKMSAIVQKLVPQPAAGLGLGFIFGGNNLFSQNILENFSRTGTTHIVAVSGFNVTIVAEYLMFLGIWLGLWRPKAIWFALCGIVLFVFMAGMPASAVRAGIMSSVLLWAMKNGRLAHSFNAVVFAGAVMLLLNPLLLRWDIGFQLSFLATLGIVGAANFWDAKWVKKHKAFGLTEIIYLTICAQILVLPILMYNFHSTSLISILANVLVLPIIPFAMLMVFLVSVAGLLWLPLGMLFAWLAFLPLAYVLKTVEVLAGISWASVPVENFAPWMVIGYYAILILAVLLFKKK